MGRKAKEYKSGDFIFAKVKGYPAWPARVQKLNGKKYFVYFYGTGETANLAPNMVFDYVENKEKFLTKTVKRRDFNDAVKQIQHDFANNVPLDQVISNTAEMLAKANDTADESAINDTMDTTADTADDTVADTTVNTTQESVEDSDDAGALVIDEGKQGKAKKAKTEPAKTPAKETPTKGTPAKGTPAQETPAKETPKSRTPRGRPKKEEPKDEKEEDAKKEEEIVSRSGRKIRPKRYIDEQTEENATLPSPHPKKRRANSPEKDKDTKEASSKTEKDAPQKEKAGDKNIKHFNAVSQSDLEDLKEPFKPADPEKENILIVCLPSGQYIGVKLFQARPHAFRGDAARLQWDKQAAANALTLKVQLEKGQITPQSVVAQLVMDLNLTDEEKATLDKERETEEKRYRVQFLKTEMKLIELDAKIKTCLCLEKADTELCLKLLDEMSELDVKPLMLLKHPTCLETVKRMRAYVGNTPSWDLSESDAIVFSKQAHRIRKHCDTMYKYMKDLFTTPDGLSFWEFFSERVLQFKKATAKLNADELLEMVHEPLEMSTPTSHTMKAAIDAANDESQAEEEAVQKKKTPAKAKKSTSTPAKPTPKRQSSRRHHTETEEKASENEKEEPKTAEKSEKAKAPEKPVVKEVEKTPEVAQDNASDDKGAENDAKTNGPETDSSETAKENPEEATDKENEDMSVDQEEIEKVQEDGVKEKEDAKTEEKEDEKKEQKQDANKEKKEAAKKEQKDAAKKEKQDAKKEKIEASKKEQKEDAMKDQNEDAKKEQNNDDAKKDQNEEAKKDQLEQNENATKEQKEQNEDAKKEHREQNEDSKKEQNEDEKKEQNGDAKKEQKEDAKKDQKEDAKKEEKEQETDEPRAKRSKGGESKKSEPPSRSPARRKAKA